MRHQALDGSSPQNLPHVRGRRGAKGHQSTDGLRWEISGKNSTEVSFFTQNQLLPQVNPGFQKVLQNHPLKKQTHHDMNTFLLMNQETIGK